MDSLEAGDPPADAARPAVQAAAEGSEANQKMQAVQDRAAYFAACSFGVLDGGSVVGRLVFEEVAGRTI